MAPMQDKQIPHDLSEETIEAKALWFQSLSLEKRMEVFCAFTDLVLAANPLIVEKTRARAVEGRVRVLSTS